jgi:hypothetical protein
VGSSPTGPTTQFSATDKAGNAATFTVSLGTIQPANQITDPVIQACTDNIANLGSGLDRSLAIPISLHMQVTSSLPTTVSIRLGSDYLAEIGGQPDTALANPIFFAKNYTEGPQCGSLLQDADEAASVAWKDATPTGQYTWHGYILQANALTPSDPTGATSDLHKLLIDPEVFLTDPISLNLTYNPANSPFEVTCQYPSAKAADDPSSPSTPSKQSASDAKWHNEPPGLIRSPPNGAAAHRQAES